MGGTHRYLLPGLLFAAGLVLLLLYGLQTGDAPPQITITPDTRTTSGAATTNPSPAETATSVTGSGHSLPVSRPGPLPLDYLQRFGVTTAMNDVEAALDAGLPFGSYASWNVSANPARPHGVRFWQMIRLQGDTVRTPWQEIDAALAANTGAIWLIGNEPDVVIQDNVPPEQYADLYHQLYTYIKTRDPSARVAIGGVSQPTPLRRAYLDIVLQTYEQRYGRRMPVDIWNVHAFILREEHDSWGMGIPPAMSDELAIKYEIEDHLDMEIFRQNIIEFRQWMARRGYGDRPLVVSEYGFLMPQDYGFSPAEVADFMTATFDFFRTARNDTGYAEDDGRLVQWWFWFILSGSPDDEYAPTFLYDRVAGDLTHLGQAYAGYVRAHTP